MSVNIYITHLNYLCVIYFKRLFKAKVIAIYCEV